jgi:hypothetical protein
VLAEGANLACDLAQHVTLEGKVADQVIGYLKNCEDGIKLTFCKPEKLRSAVSTGSGYYSKSMIDQLQCAGECTICLAL